GRLGLVRLFCGAWGAPPFWGVSFFFWGRAIGRFSLSGPPASGAPVCCPDFCGVGVGEGWVWAKSHAAGQSSIDRARASRAPAIALEKLDEWPARIKNISACLFERFYSSIDART